MGPEAIDRINELLDEVTEKLDWVVGKINGLLSHVPGFLHWAVDKFMALWNIVLEKAKQFWDKVVEFVSYLGQPWDLNGAKDDWVSLGGPVAARASQADKSQSDVDFRWEGRAADRYANSLGAQNKALSGVQSKLANPMGPALSSLAGALYIFFGVVIGVIIALVVAHTVAGGEAVSILGLPAVPPTLITAYGVALVALIGAIANLNNAANNANTVFQTVAAEASDFGSGGWPQAVIG